MPIRGIITDVDGVIVGAAGNGNFPLPGQEIVDALQSLHNKGLMVSLCTGKPHFSISQIAQYFPGPHISDGGSVIFKEGKKCKAWEINHDIIPKIVSKLQGEGIFTEFMAGQDWYVENDQEISLTHLKVLQKPPIVVDKLSNVTEPVQKIVAVINHPSKEEGVENMLLEFSEDITLSWAIHPSMPKTRFGIITAKGITKETGARYLSEITGIPLSEMLGVGDGDMDWDFIKLCGYKAAMGNAQEGLKKKVKEQDGFIGKEVDEGGFLDVLNHFGFN